MSGSVLGVDALGNHAEQRDREYWREFSEAALQEFERLQAARAAQSSSAMPDMTATRNARTPCQDSPPS